MFRLAFKEASEYWMSTDDDVRFKGGIGAVMLHLGTNHPEYKRIEIELEQINLLRSPCPDFEPIGIIKLWKEIRQ